MSSRTRLPTHTSLRHSQVSLTLSLHISIWPPILHHLSHSHFPHVSRRCVCVYARTEYLESTGVCEAIATAVQALLKQTDAMNPLEFLAEELNPSPPPPATAAAATPPPRAQLELTPEQQELRTFLEAIPQGHLEGQRLNLGGGPKMAPKKGRWSSVAVCSIALAAAVAICVGRARRGL